MVKKVDIYKFLQLIGEGRYGSVFKAENQKTKQQVAIKVIKYQTVKTCPYLEALLSNSIDKLSNIQSPHIVRFVQILKTQRNFYFVYEYCNECNLKQKIKLFGNLNEYIAINYFQQLISAFKILHQKNILHQNVYISNILIHNGKVKLGGFQLSQTNGKKSHLIVKSLEFPIYKPPQMIKGENYKQESEIWMLGIVLYEMFCGSYIYGDPAVQKVYLGDEISMPFYVKISKETNNLLKSMLNPDPSKRIGWKQLFELFEGKEQNIQKKFENFQAI